MKLIYIICVVLGIALMWAGWKIDSLSHAQNPIVTITENNARDQVRIDTVILERVQHKTIIKDHYDTVFTHDNRLSADALDSVFTTLLRQYVDTNWNKIDSIF